MNNIFNKVKNLTLLSEERVNINIKSIDYIIDNNIDGDIVEIGVYKGGSILSLILQLEYRNFLNKTIHLYDTFEGMTESSIYDIDINNILAENEKISYLCKCDLESVKFNIRQNVNYPNNLINYHIGDILKNKFIPDKISILRLDTDWYESTKFELETFYPNVSSSGIIIVDDYGHWSGCKKAVDEFLINHPSIEIIKIDYTGIYFYKK